MVARKRLALNDDLPPVFCRTVKARHQKMQVCSQCLHDDDFVRKRPDNFGRLVLHCIVNV